MEQRAREVLLRQRRKGWKAWNHSKCSCQAQDSGSSHSLGCHCLFCRGTWAGIGFPLRANHSIRGCQLRQASPKWRQFLANFRLGLKEGREACLGPGTSEALLVSLFNVPWAHMYKDSFKWIIDKMAINTIFAILTRMRWDLEDSNCWQGYEDRGTLFAIGRSVVSYSNQGSV